MKSCAVLAATGDETIGTALDGAVVLAAHALLKTLTLLPQEAPVPRQLAVDAPAEEIPKTIPLDTSTPVRIANSHRVILLIQPSFKSLSGQIPFLVTASSACLDIQVSTVSGIRAGDGNALTRLSTYQSAISVGPFLVRPAVACVNVYRRAVSGTLA